MNEQIQELAKQSGFVDGHRIPYGYNISISPQLEKFAELIIQECCQALWTDACHISDLAIIEFNSNSGKIKRHFGVE